MKKIIIPLIFLMIFTASVSGVNAQVTEDVTNAPLNVIGGSGTTTLGAYLQLLKNAIENLRLYLPEDGNVGQTLSKTTDGAEWNDLATVATTGSYDDLTDKPTVSASAWGDIGGNIADQIDLNNILNTKANASDIVVYNTETTFSGTVAECQLFLNSFNVVRSVLTITITGGSGNIEIIDKISGIIKINVMPEATLYDVYIRNNTSRVLFHVELYDDTTIQGNFEVEYNINNVIVGGLYGKVNVLGNFVVGSGDVTLCGRSLSNVYSTNKASLVLSNPYNINETIQHIEALQYGDIYIENPSNITINSISVYSGGNIYDVNQGYFSGSAYLIAGIGKEVTENKDAVIPMTPITGHYPETSAVKTYVDTAISAIQLPEHYKGQLEYVCADAATREALTDVAVGAKALTLDDNIVAYYDDTGGFSAWAYLESLTPQAGDYYYVLNLTNLTNTAEGSITYNGATWDIAPDHYHQPDNQTIVLNEAGQLAVANPEGFGVKATPDYANMETTNRIPTSSGSWTADRDGWVRLTAVATGSSGQTGMRASINGKLVVTKWVNGISQNDTSEILPVKAGDVIILETIGAMSSQGCQFIPPKYEFLQANTANVSNVVVDCVPDYANMTAGLAGGSAGVWSWTAQQSGFVSYDLYGNSSILINGSVVATAESTTMTTGITPVNTGNVVTSTGALSVYVRFVPPRYVLAGKTIPVASDNYSLQETDTGKTWIDGKKIYRQCFSGNLVSAADTNSYITVSNNADSIIDNGGWWQVGEPIRISINRPAGNGTRLSGFLILNNVLQFFSISNLERTGTTNNAYQFWVEYTKTTD